MNAVRRNQLLYFVAAIVLGIIGYRGLTKQGTAPPDSSGCVIIGPDSKRITPADSKNGRVFMPKGSTLTGECLTSQ